MRRMYSNKELTEIIKQVIEESGIGGGGLDVVMLTQGDPALEYTDVTIPFAIALFDSNGDLMSTGNVQYEYGGTSTFGDPDSGTQYEITFTNINYDENARQLKADVRISEQA